MTNSAEFGEFQIIDHIGWDLWQATQNWKKELVAGMIARGFHDYGDARYSLLRHIGPSGLSQSRLTTVSGLSKQAVQQQIDDLVRDTIVTRQPDPDDARKKRIVLTDSGRLLYAEIDAVKIEIETRYEQVIGQQRMADLKDILKEINDNQNAQS
ncbi:MarR family winged helix-turn-helix transcriptional regulator [Roseobacter sp. CCS2]|uniref:MarR family winged helix-turn-helix transcriptional regulator n=1 Tax=Roseobacter sp. CCS2 TaxID=391593 RepID=UPI0000F4019E|nr:MarR family transcriptional regulator [Roseobacter sp. CCS2]EBA14057.1 transcriptional regulator [Roseobacter sp. CCS2]